MILKILLTLLPSILWFYYLIIKKENLLLHFKLYLSALLMVVPVLLIERIAISLFNLSDGIVATIILSFIVIALVEETVKFLVLRQSLNYVNFRSFTLMQAVFLGFTVGFGFAQGENILYSLFFTYETILFRILVTPLLHAIFSGIVGFYLFRAIKEEEKLLYKGWLIAVLLHGLYDFLLLS